MPSSRARPVLRRFARASKPSISASGVGQKVSRHDDRRSVDGVMLDGGERLVGLVQGKYGYLWLQPYVGGSFEKVSRVGSSHVCDAADLALAPQQPVVIEFGDTVEMDRVDRDDASFSQAGERRDHDVSAGRKRHSAIEFDRRLVGFTAHPGCSQTGSQLTMGSATRRDVDLAAPGMQNRNRQMRRCAKSEQSNAVARLNAGYSQTAKPNDAGAEKRRGVEVVQFRRQFKYKVAARRGILRIAAIDGVSGEDRRIAEVFEST